jgi:hypothetical protein
VKTLIAFAVLFCALRGRPASTNDFALRDGDTVAFLGDSITAARGSGAMGC